VHSRDWVLAFETGFRSLRLTEIMRIHLIGGFRADADQKFQMQSRKQIGAVKITRSFGQIFGHTGVLSLKVLCLLGQKIVPTVSQQQSDS